MSVYGRVFAALYDVFFQRAERAGLARQRAAVVGEARGRVLEIGAGTGLNLEHYPRGLEELVLSEPEEPMARKLEGKVADQGRDARVVIAGAEELPFEDDLFDTVVSTLVLCTVPDPQAALLEIDRVLKPGGRFLFLEHVRAESPRLARWQDRLHGPWYLFGNGCHCNRSTPDLIERSPLEVERLERGRIEKMPPIVQPSAAGAAVAARA